MKISQENADRLQELQNSIEAQVGEFIKICRQAMDKSEYEMFRYRCLAHLTPVFSNNHEWAVGAGVDNLEEIVQRAQADATEENAQTRQLAKIESQKAGLEVGMRSLVMQTCQILLKEMGEDERLDFWRGVQEGYCTYCGSDKRPCLCKYDV